MKETVIYPKLLKELCPQCKTNLHAWFYMPTSDFPTLGSWIVECNSDECNYRYEDEFCDENDLEKSFTVDNSVSADYNSATKIPKKSLSELVKGKQIENVIYEEDENQAYLIFTDKSILEIGRHGFDLEEFYCEFHESQIEFHRSGKYLSNLYKMKVGRIKIMNDKKD